MSPLKENVSKLKIFTVQWVHNYNSSKLKVTTTKVLTTTSSHNKKSLQLKAKRTHLFSPEKRKKIKVLIKNRHYCAEHDSYFRFNKKASALKQLVYNAEPDGSFLSGCTDRYKDCREDIIQTIKKKKFYNFKASD